MRRLLIYVHYNKYGGFSDYVDYQLEKLAPLFEKVIFVSNSSLEQSVQDYLIHKFHFSELLIRENFGYDFAAWRDGLQILDESELYYFNSITLMNDTCFGPLWNLEVHYNYFEQEPKTDFWGMTNHAEVVTDAVVIPEHLQSYFMVFHKNVVQSGIFLEFFKHVVDFKDVQKVIDQYETQLTSILKSAGFQYGVLLDTLSLPNNNQLNFSLYHPKLLLDHRVPFLKVKLFELHQYISPYILSDLRKSSEYPTDFITEHVSRVYYPDSIYKLSQKELTNKYDAEAKLMDLDMKIAYHIHITDIWAFDIILEKLTSLKTTFDLFVTVDSVELETIIKEKLKQFKSPSEIILLADNTFSLQPLYLIGEKLMHCECVGFLNTHVLTTDDFYSGKSWFLELVEMMISKTDSIIATLTNEKNTGLVIPDIPTAFRYNRLVDADMENELASEMTKIWEQIGAKKEIEFSTFETFVMSYGGALWLKRKVLEEMLKVPMSQLIVKDYTLKNKMTSVLERLPVYLAWNLDLDFKISENPVLLPALIDHKLLNRRKEYQEVIVTKEVQVEVVKEIEVEVVKEVEKTIYPDFYIDMTDLSLSTGLKYLIIAPLRVFKFIMKWSILKMKDKIKDKK